MLTNVAVILVLILASSGYLWISPSFMPQAHSITVVLNLIVVPFALGILAGYLLIARLMFKLAALLFIPITHVLIFGGDPAKPGLENLVALVELVPLWMGCLVAHILLKRNERSAAARNGTSNLT